ncbi:uncharacterized protein L199_007418 [Kwoniella botswanensis]|uniref:uncharacterized protein n=1 Tax=Kwoniella botswanensis TaxID=1268659 RepID=UPI00315C8458
MSTSSGNINGSNRIFTHDGKALQPHYRSIIDKLGNVSQKRSARGLAPDWVTWHTDAGDDKMSDHDDLVAGMNIASLATMGIVDLKGITITGLHRKHNASIMEGFMRSLGLPDVPVWYGTEEFDPNDHDKDRLARTKKRAATMTSKDPITKWQRFHQIDTDIRNSKKSDIEPDDYITGFSRICDEAKAQGRKIKMAITTGHQTVNSLLTDPETATKFTDQVEKVIFQGGMLFNDGKIVPAEDARNNFYNISACREFLGRLQASNMPTDCYTKNAATACAIEPPFLSELASTGHPGGRFVHELASSVDATQFFDTLNDERLFSKNFTTDLFLKFKTTLSPEEAAEKKKFFVDKWGYQDKSTMTKEGYTDYLSDYSEQLGDSVKAVPYDPEVIVGLMDEEYLTELGVLPEYTKDQDSELEETFKLYGKSRTDCGVNTRNMKDTIIALAGHITLVTEPEGSEPIATGIRRRLTGEQATRDSEEELTSCGSDENDCFSCCT